MTDRPIHWDKIDLTFGVELPDFDAPEQDSGEPCLSIAENIFDLPGRDLMCGGAPSRKRLARRTGPRQTLERRPQALGLARNRPSRAH